MPDRLVREDILTSDPVNSLSWAGEVFYRRVMSKADDYGRYEARPSILRANLYPLKLDRVSESDVVKWMGECSEAGLVRLYTVENKEYLEIQKFRQRLRAMKSRYPPPPADAREHPPSSADICQQPPADVDNGLLKRSETESESETETEGEEKPPPPPVEVVNTSVTYDIEADLLKSQATLEAICMGAGRDIETAKFALTKYHLNLQKKEEYPKSRAALTAGFKLWLLNEKSDGKKNSANPTTKQATATGHTGL
jgi:hypothetical protein